MDWRVHIAGEVAVEAALPMVVAGEDSRIPAGELQDKPVGEPPMEPKRSGKGPPEVAAAAAADRVTAGPELPRKD